MTAPATTTDILLVSHTHWDREWYRTFEAFRARLVDAVDRVLELLDADPGWRFVLDGQAIVAEDYLAVRPGARAALEAAVTSGRLALGPWYVQPDSLLPSGEAHVRNLLEGRAVARSLGGCSTVAYTPDSFGHPAHFPQLFAGFGLEPFVYWRGNGNELDRLGPLYRWRSPDASTVVAYHLGASYSSAAGLPEDPTAAVDALVAVLDHLPRSALPVVLMNGVDHMYPYAHTEAVAHGLAATTGRRVDRVLLDELTRRLHALGDLELPEHTGDLLGGRVANLLPGVWSARLGLKLANRAAERALVGWAEPWAAMGTVHGLPDEQAALRLARRALLANQAHDSIGGCSQDEVHRQMAGRTAAAVELADQTTRRTLERLAGLGAPRAVPWDAAVEVAVFNPSPQSRTDVVTVALDGYPALRISHATTDVHPLVLGEAVAPGYTVDGTPVRVRPATDPGRVRVVDTLPPLDVDLVATDVPAFGWRRFRLVPGPGAPEAVDDGRVISAGALVVRVDEGGCFDVDFGDGHRYRGLGRLEDRGDRGDTYDFDAVPDDPGILDDRITVRRSLHPSGIQELRVRHELDVPARLDAAHAARVEETATLTVELTARVAPGVDRVDLVVDVDNRAEDHRLRVAFPTHRATRTFRAATTLGVAERSTARPDDAGWHQPAPSTFPHQGWIAAHDLLVGAPGLPEGEVTPDGTILVTLLRAVGWLTRFDLVSRPVPAGPAMPTPEAQCPGHLRTVLSLRVDRGAATALADELGLRAVAAGPAPLVPSDTSLLSVEPPELVCSALKPAEDGDGVIVRLLNPDAVARHATLTLAPVVEGAESVRLDETPDGGEVDRGTHHVTVTVGPRGARTLRLRLRAGG